MILLGKVAVVGAGFVGSFISYLLAKKHIDVTIYEENKSIGIPEHCAGLVSQKGLERLGILRLVKNEGLIINNIKCAVVYAGKTKRKICLKKQKIGVLDRPRLDALIAQKATDYGADIKLSNRVKEIRTNGILKTEKHEQKYDIIIDAEGTKRLLLREIIGKNFLFSLPAAQMDIKIQKEVDPESVEVHFRIPDFFLWVIPLGNSMVRIGFASRKIHNHILFLSKFARHRFGAYKIIKRFGGMVHIDGPYKKFVFGKIVGVGDVVGQTKPTTGGGVIIGGLSACILAETIKKHIEIGTPLSLYEKIWSKIFAPEIKFMKTIKNIAFSLDARVIPKIPLSMLPKKITIETDFDFQSKILTKIFRQ